MVSKRWLFTQGGRPVIYQTNVEYDQLPESHRWRHMLYDIREGFSYSDFSWEREWRIRVDELAFDHTVAKIIIPNEEWSRRLIADHDSQEDYFTRQYSVVLGEILADMYRRPFGWEVLALGPGFDSCTFTKPR